jgi:hypothetical protein
MAIVPPGNKQVEIIQSEFVVTSDTSLKITGITSYGVVKNLSQNYPGTQVLNKQIDSLSFETVVTANNLAVSLNSSIVYGVVKYTPPRTLKVEGLGLYGVVKDKVANTTLTATRNKQVDTLSIETVVYNPNIGVALTGTQLYGVVKFTMPRNEALIFSLYYGENNPYL